VVTIDIDLRQQESGAGTTCLQILGSLPEWFGIEAAVQHYAEVADRSHTIVATARGEDVGLLVITHHSPYAAEVYVMAVRPEHYRRGIGRWMLALAEATLAAGGTEYLQVKTLSSSHRDEGTPGPGPSTRPAAFAP
jgi:GNAT superfamily N-acetyltransferase